MSGIKGAGHSFTIILSTLREELEELNLSIERETVKRVVVLNYHTVGKNLKVISHGYGFQLLFKNEFRLSQLTHFDNQTSGVQKATVSEQESVKPALCMKYLSIVCSVTLSKRTGTSCILGSIEHIPFIRVG